MGIYLNPGNSGFQSIINSEYVDKTGLIRQVNDSIGTVNNLICISRPRRFGKSYAAQMLCAYYDCSCDSHGLFDDKEIAGTEGYLAHLNQYQVMNLDITTFLSAAQRKGIPLKEVPDMIVNRLFAELEEFYPDCTSGGGFADSLVRCVEKTGRKFVFVIDEWDALIREAKDDAVAQKRYLSLLREWFKSNNFTPKVVAAAYMTGILPIKKDGSQSAISDFTEYPILNPGAFAEYTGFTEEDVRKLCSKYGMSFEETKKWYDGYDFSEIGAVYNPYSVMCAV
ncbi:MAG: AAA family ATPase, partial [Lachnospiraceae bacterium]|nr:AAA family ATPase [Lachnospiraceae bacterium]